MQSHGTWLAIILEQRIQCVFFKPAAALPFEKAQNDVDD
jgi:hypothetical protein